MATKTGNWLMVAGGFIAFVGLCFLPAAFGADSDRTMLGAGAVVISAGLLLIAAGFYFKGQNLGTTAAPANAPASAKRNRKNLCDRCAENDPVIQCRVHQLHLCAECLNIHYDFRSCAYIPTTRRVAPAKSTAAAYSQAAAR